jgi:hypothetical protein
VKPPEFFEGRASVFQERAAAFHRLSRYLIDTIGVEYPTQMEKTLRDAADAQWGASCASWDARHNLDRADIARMEPVW